MGPGAARVDLTNCDTEPIHIPGSIQPHGVLLGVDEADWRVAVVSRNVEELLGRPVTDVLGAPLAAVLGEGPADAVQRHVAVAELHVEGAGVPLRLARGVGRAAWVGQPVEAVMHRSGGLLVVEIEPDLRDPSSAPLSHRATRAARDPPGRDHDRAGPGPGAGGPDPQPHRSRPGDGLPLRPGVER